MGDYNTTDFMNLSAYRFTILNWPCALCFAAIGAIKQEMSAPKWSASATGCMCGGAETTLERRRVHMTLGECVILLALAGIAGLAIRSLWRTRKSCEACSGDCSRCGGCRPK